MTHSKSLTLYTRVLLAAVLSLILTSTTAQTQEEIDAYPEVAGGLAKFGYAWESHKV